MDVIELNQTRRRRERTAGATGGDCKVLRMDRLSDGVLLRVVKRQAARELERLQYVLQITGGDPAILPTPEQMEEMENGTIEF